MVGNLTDGVHSVGFVRAVERFRLSLSRNFVDGYRAAMSSQESGNRNAELLSDQCQSLLEVTESIVSHRNLEKLLHDLARPLRKIIQFDYLSVRLHDPERNVMRIHMLEKSAPGELEFELPVEGSLGGHVWQTQEPLLIDDIDHEARFPRAVQRLRANNVNSCCCLPLTTVHRRLGAMTIGSLRTKAYQRTDFPFLEQVARQVALAVENALNFQQVQSVQQQVKEEHDRLRLLLDLNNTIVSALDLRELLNAASASLRRLVRHEYASLALYDSETQRLRIHALDFPLSKGLIGEGQWMPLEGAPHARALASGQPLFMTRGDVEQLDSDIARRFLAEGLRSTCILPLVSRGRPLGTLAVASLRDDTFPQEDAELLQTVANQIAIAVENAVAFGRVVDRANKLTEEKLYLQDEIRTEYNFEEIVGESLALKHILQQVQTVAPTDSTVLILGETGTGKELIARAIHNLSARRERTFVKVNCAAIPTGLLESELFGHEKGAFTGAITQRIGRFELANRGSLFLDEVGDIPLELQPKLLRVLQEQEFERLGSTRTVRVDVRLIAATNSNLVEKVDEKSFRSDLFYRLNVFPITLPPLRERREDIPLLAYYFAQKYARRMRKAIETVPSIAMNALVEYHWPGNVRELENFIERAVILSRGADLEIPLSQLKQPTHPVPPNSSADVFTLERAEREHILRALDETNWIVGGTAGAASKLGMKRTTLQSKMRKLGIARPS
jgi:formate hydrogenlyase transcriptional activator